MVQVGQCCRFHTDSPIRSLLGSAVEGLYMNTISFGLAFFENCYNRVERQLFPIAQSGTTMIGVICMGCAAVHNSLVSPTATLCCAGL